MNNDCIRAKMFTTRRKDGRPGHMSNLTVRPVYGGKFLSVEIQNQMNEFKVITTLEPEEQEQLRIYLNQLAEKNT